MITNTKFRYSLTSGLSFDSSFFDTEFSTTQMAELRKRVREAVLPRWNLPRNVQTDYDCLPECCQCYEQFLHEKFLHEQFLHEQFLDEQLLDEQFLDEQCLDEED